MIDSDELIVPQKVNTLDEMLPRIFGKSKLNGQVGALNFKNTVYYTDHPSNIVNSQDPITTGAFYHLQPGTGRAKYMVDPKLCILASAHFCNHRHPNTFNINVDPHTATSQHYKRCTTARQRNSTICTFNEEYVYDAKIMRYKTQLSYAVSKVLMEFKEMLSVL